MAKDKDIVFNSSPHESNMEEIDVLSESICMVCDDMFSDEAALKHHVLNVHFSENQIIHDDNCETLNQENTINGDQINVENKGSPPLSINNSILDCDLQNDTTIKTNNGTPLTNVWAGKKGENVVGSLCEILDPERHLENYVILKQSSIISNCSLETVINPTMPKMNSFVVENTSCNTEGINVSRDINSEFQANVLTNSFKEDSYSELNRSKHKTQDKTNKTGLKPPEKPCKNNILVYKIFKAIEELKTRRIATPVNRPHSCSVCGESFRRLERLQQHMVIHDIIPYDKSLESSIRNTDRGRSRDLVTSSQRKETTNGFHDSSDREIIEYCSEQTLVNTKIGLNLAGSGSMVSNDKRSVKKGAILNSPQMNHAGYEFVCSSCEINSSCPNSQPTSSKLTKLFVCLFCHGVYTVNAITNHMTKVHRHRKELKYNMCYVVLYYETYNMKFKKSGLKIPLDCQRCGKGLCENQGIENHLKLYNPLRKCKDCGRRLYNQSYAKHRRVCRGPSNEDEGIENNLKPYDGRCKCKDCGKMLKIQSYANHRKVFHGEFNKLYSCRRCKKFYYTINSLRNHVIRTHYKKPTTCVKCKFCSKPFFFSHTLAYHIKKTHKGTPHKCKRCNQFFSTIQEQGDHLRAKHPEKKLICEYCGKIFPQVVRLTHHIRKHTGEKPYMCDICGKAFRTNSGLHKHLLIHSEVYQYNCDICGKGLRRRHHLKQHMDKHIRGINDNK